MHFSKDNDKDKPHPFDDFSDEELDHIFDRMQQFFKSEEFKEIVEDIMYDVLSEDDEEDDDSFYKPSLEDDDFFPILINLLSDR